jgi:DNA primase
VEALAKLASDLRLTFDKTPGEGPLMANCLWHADDTASLAIYFDHVYCFGCNKHAWPDQLMAELATRTNGIAELQTRRTARRKCRPGYKYIPDSMVDTYHKWLMEKFADRKDWLYSRGLREDTITENKIGHCGNAFTIPVMGAAGWASIRYRRDDALSEGEAPKYWGTSGANDTMLYFPNTPPMAPIYRTQGGGAILCEGELDALRLTQEGYWSFSLTNGCNSFKPAHIEHLPEGPIYIAYDQDDKGRVAAGRIAGIIGDRAKVITWPEALGKDVTEFLQRWPLSAFKRYLTQAEAT